VPTFEQYHSKRPLTPFRAPGVPVQQIADTGQGIQAQALEQAAQATSAIVNKWYEREGNTQFDTQRRIAGESINEFHRTAYATADEHDSGYRKMRSGLKSLRPDNPRGAEKFQSWLDRISSFLDREADVKKINTIKINNEKDYFRNLVSVSATKDFTQAQAEARLLTQGAIDDRTRTPAQAASDFDKIMGDWQIADLSRRSQTIIRPDGEVDWSETVDYLNQPENTEGIDFDVLKSLKSNAETELANQKSRDEEAIEAQREVSRNFLNDKFANNQVPTPTEIDNAGLDENEQKAYIKWAAAETRRIAAGEIILTNQKARADLNTMALDIWRGAVTKQQFDTAVNEARYGDTPTIDDATYKELTNTAATTLKSAQAEAIRRADTEAGRLIVDVRDEDAFADFLKGLDTTNRDKETDKRQLQFWYLSQYNKEVRDWITENPDKIGKDFFQHSEQLKHDYWNSSIEDIKAKKLEREEELVQSVSVVKTQAEYDALPKGTRYQDINGNFGTKR